MPSRRGITALVLLLQLVLVGPALPYRSPLGVAESQTIGELRTLVAGQTVYASLNQDLFAGDLRCLTDPASCIDGYQGPVFVDAFFVDQPVRHGYRWTFHPGAAPTATDAVGQAPARSSARGFAATAVPVRPASKYPTGGIRACFTEQATGGRGFCTDESGRICFTSDGSEPAVTDARCQPCANELD